MALGVEKQVKVGLIGAGFAGNFHAYGIHRVYGINAKVSVLCEKNEALAKKISSKYGIEKNCADYRTLLDDKSIDVIDICAPTNIHHVIIKEALDAGKHVICEKPLTGYFGEPGDPELVGTVDKQKMYDVVSRRVADLQKTVKSAKTKFMYAENWVYAPAVQRTTELLNASKDKILMMKADESHSGAHTALANEWRNSGGGVMIRQGCHPLSAVLFLKQFQARVRGEKFGVESVYADLGYVAQTLDDYDHRKISAHPKDVEDLSMLHITFIDGTKATIFAGDVVTGGIRNTIEVNTTTSNMYCNICQNNSLLSYSADPEPLKDLYITGNLETKAGYQFVQLEEEWFRGQVQEFQDFMECVAFGREPVSNIDIACDAMRVLYAAYLSAEEGKKILL